MSRKLYVCTVTVQVTARPRCMLHHHHHQKKKKKNYLREGIEKRRTAMGFEQRGYIGMCDRKNKRINYLQRRRLYLPLHHSVYDKPHVSYFAEYGHCYLHLYRRNRC